MHMHCRILATLSLSKTSMTRIFLTLAICSTVTLLTALWLGLEVGDAALRSTFVQSRVAVHFLTGVAAIVFAVLVHALVVTYFMGTGRWLEETCNAYRLGDEWQTGSRISQTAAFVQSLSVGARATCDLPALNGISRG
jgi:hypothetical protein